MMLEGKNRRIGAVYVALQAIVWAKSFYFFAIYGHGKSAEFSLAAFSAEALLFEHFFHNGVHIGIAILALLFGKNLLKLEWVKLAAIVFVAVALHNTAYWITASHPGLRYSVSDFARDALLLFLFVVVGYALKKIFLNRKV